MYIELLNGILRKIDEVNKNLANCIKNGIEFETFDKKSDSLGFVFGKNNTDNFIEILPLCDNELIFQDIEGGKMLSNIKLDIKELYDDYYLDFGYGAKYENNEFYYRISILKINRKTEKVEDGFLFTSRFKEYKKYLSTKIWEWKRKEKLEEAKYKCQLCGKSNTELHVHHNNYDNLCFEEMSDLIVLCKKCHEKFHDIEDI